MSASPNEQVQADADVARHPRLPAALTAHLSRLFSAGYSLLPLGGADGKQPIVQFRGRRRLPLSAVIDRLANGGSRCYGIRLAGLLVVDADSDTPETADYIKRRFGTSPIRVRTSRGYHLYFRHVGVKPRQVRRPGIAIDFKSGENEFVVGPLSERPGGFIYQADGELVPLDALPLFQDLESEAAAQEEPEKVNGRYPQGMRHSVIKRRAHQLAMTCENFPEMLAIMMAFRDGEIERPGDFPDARLKDLAWWFWDLREKGLLWTGRNSVVTIPRSAIQDLVTRGEFLALAILNLLSAEHGHTAEQPFAIVPDALRASGRLPAGRRQIYLAIELLVELGLLDRRNGPKGRRNHSIYQLGQGKQEKEKGESKLILVSPQDTQTCGKGGRAA